MVYIDIHSHIVFYPREKIEKIVQNAKKSDVKIILDNGLNKETNRKIISLSKKYHEIKPVLGLYPSDAVKLSKKEIDEEIEFIKNNKEKIVAIGEVGLDLKKDKNLKEQIKIFEKFIKLSKELDIPIIVHSRKAEEKAIEILEKNSAKKVIMHCFCGKFKLVERIIENKWFLSIPANVTNSEQFQKIVKEIPLENIFCETDSPFLHPKKEKNNEPANVIESYKKISEIKKINLDKVEKKVEENYKRIFKEK